MSTNPDSKKNEQKEKKQKPDTFWSEMASLQKQRKNAEFEEAARSVKKPDNEKGGDGRTLLMLAAECGWTKAMKILLAKPAAGNINFSVVTGKTALIISAKWCQPAAVRLLLEKDASINHVCAYGWTALDYAEFRDVGTRFISAKELKHPKIAKKIKDNRKVKEILRKNGGKLAAEL
ncbi:MAG: ankyrin repeat domain-containing protein [Gammaproteobacteria bacterium]